VCLLANLTFVAHGKCKEGKDPPEATVHEYMAKRLMTSRNDDVKEKPFTILECSALAWKKIWNGVGKIPTFSFMLSDSSICTK
jgi:hypothetical protein